MDFPIAEFMDEDASYEKVVSILHPDGLACPRCKRRDGLKVHRRHPAPVLDEPIQFAESRDEAGLPASP